MRADVYVLVGEKLYAPGEELPDGLDNVVAVEGKGAKPEPVPEPAPVPASAALPEPAPAVAATPEPVAVPGEPLALPSTKPELVELAKKLGVDTSGTKAAIAERIVAAQSE